MARASSLIVREHELELAWATGFYEGEGSVTLQAGGRPAIQIGNNDPEPLRRFARAVEVGRVYGPYWDRSRKGHGRPFFVFIAAGRPALEAVVLIAPGLSRRRLQQVTEMLAGVRGVSAARADEVYAFVRQIKSSRCPE